MTTGSRLSPGPAPPGAVRILLDESYDPLVAMVAVSIEASDFDRTEQSLAAVYNQRSQDYYLEGHKSFETFRQYGFHAASDPVELRTDFVRYLAETASFKTSIVFSDGLSRPDLGKKARQMLVLNSLMRDILRQYRRRPRVDLIFESNGGMDSYVELVVNRTKARLGRTCPETTIDFRPKRDPHLLAIPDYVLHIFNRWYAPPNGDPGATFDKDKVATRDLRAVLGSVSEARSLEGDVVVRRDTALREVLDS